MQKSQVEIMKVGHKKWNDETWTLITCSMKWSKQAIVINISWRESS
jgi:hypothetical protein